MESKEMELFYDFMAKSPVLLGKEMTQLLKSVCSESDEEDGGVSEKVCFS